MKKILSTIVGLLCLTAISTTAQVVTTSPATVTQSSAGVVITFHADGGNKGMMGVTSSTPVYAHTGVITTESTSASDWKYAPEWGDNSAKYKMTYVSDNTWTLTIPDIRAYYGLTDAGEEVKQLAFVFRTGDGKREAKTATGGDILVQIFPDNFPSSKAAAYPGGQPKMGPVKNADGSVTFGLAAPGKSNVLLVGSWNDYAITSSQVMDYQEVNGIRYFHTTVSGLADGTDQIYYYLVDGATRVGDPYGRLILDPWNDGYIPSTVFPDMPVYPSDKLSNVPVAVYNSSRDEYDWNVTDFKGVKQSDLIIYELLLRDFTGTEGEANAEGTVAMAMEKLDYLKELGVNAIELMPIMEFSGNNSWGYNPNFYFAPDKAYGTPQAYKAFIDGAHERGMAVILDVVFNQSDSQHPWYEMYRQTAPERFFNGSAPHDYNVFNDWNQDYAPVFRQWCDVLDYWLTEYKVDGFRFDLVKGLGDSDSYGTTYNAATNTYAAPTATDTDKYNATRVARMKALRDHAILTKPDVYFINENLASAQEENEMAADGEINWANINEAACEYAMGYLTNASLDRFYAPSDGGRYRGSTVSYAESHDEERVAYKAATYGVDELKGNSNNKLVLRCLRLGSLAAQMLLTPGAHMIWQFEELGANESTKTSTGGNNTDAKTVMWENLDNKYYAGLHDSYADLCGIRSKYAYMFAEDASCRLDLNSVKGRYISLASGTSELYLVVNPAVTGSADVMPYHAVTGSPVDLTGFELLATSYNTVPTLSANGVNLPGGTFAVYGKDLKSGISDITAATGSAIPEIDVINGVITPRGKYTTFTIHTLAGVSLPIGTPLAPGLYIATIDGQAIKVGV